jgi:CubicO group peptidase (beta-lactamase class C family)
MTAIPMLPMVAVLLLGPVSGCDTVLAPARDLPGFEAQLESLRRGLNIPGLSAAIAKDGRVVWSKGFGVADREGQLVARDTTAFHLASLTKTMGSVILMQLVEAGRVGLDDPVSQYGIQLASPGVITVRHLLTHTSEGTPGAQFRYNGDRYGLLETVISVASGSSFGALTVERILGPLGLRHTAPNPDAAAFAFSGLDRQVFRNNLAQGYSSNGKQRLAYPTYFGVAAGMVSSALDMARYSIAIDSGAFLRRETWNSVFTPYVSLGGSTLPYALGWFVTQESGITVQWHYGYWIGNSSLIIRVPSRKLTFVVLANSDMLARNTRLGEGQLQSSSVAKAFIGAFVTGTVPLPAR